MGGTAWAHEAPVYWLPQFPRGERECGTSGTTTKDRVTYKEAEWVNVCSDLPSSHRQALVQEGAGEGPRKAKSVLGAGLVLWVQCVRSHGAPYSEGRGAWFHGPCPRLKIFARFFDEGTCKLRSRSRLREKTFAHEGHPCLGDGTGGCQSAHHPLPNNSTKTQKPERPRLLDRWSMFSEARADQEQP